MAPPFDLQGGIQGRLRGMRGRRECLIVTVRGWASGGIPEEVVPAFEELTNDPRFMEIEAAMLATTNRDREIVGLPPMDLDYKVAALTSP